MSATRILIVEDDPAFRQRFEDIVSSHRDFTLVAAVVRKPRRLHPGLDAMVVSVFGDEPHVMRSLKAGATGYLLKDSLPEDFIATIILLRSGGSPIHPTTARRLLQQFVNKSSEKVFPEVSLSLREQEFLKLVSKGFRGPEIAGLLGISNHTVSSHIKNIYKKLEVSSRGEAVYEASRLRLL